MPGQDQTGPLGQGPMTGRGLGQCGAGFRRGIGRGFGQGFGFRRGIGRFQNQNLELSKDQEQKILEADLAELEAERKEIEERIKNLK